MINKLKKIKLNYCNCPICGSEKYSIIIKQAKEQYNNLPYFFDVVSCNSCKFVFTNPRPHFLDMSYFYPDNANYYTPPKHLKERNNTFQKKIKNLVLHKFFNYPVKFKINKFFIIAIYLFKYFLLSKIYHAHYPRFIINGKLLDIGCSTGGYLKLMNKEGWQIFGLEMNKKCISYLKKNIKNLIVFEGHIEDISLKREFFDVINCSMVLEHLYNPLKSLEKIHQSLKKNGQLIVSVPNFNGIEFKLFGRFCYALQVPQHLNHFTDQTISKILKDKGFRIDKLIYQNLDKDILSSIKIWNKSKLLEYIFFNRVFRNTFLKFFIFVLSNLGMTSRIIVYATKK